MIKRRLAACAVTFGLFGASSALAQAVGIDDPEANVVEALVVAAKLPGPPWWTISDGDTTIYVLGDLSPRPSGQAWDTRVLERRLNGASTVILPSQGRVWFPLGKTSDVPLDTAAADLAPKLAQARAALGKPVDAYRDRPLITAGMMMNMDYFKLVQLESGQATRTVERLAREHRVKVRRPAVSKVKLTKAAAGERELGLICLESVLDEINSGPGAARGAAKAWAEGDVRGAITGPRSFQRCVLAMPGMADAARKATADEVEALAAAMKTPGHAVAVYAIRGLVAQGGVLDQMRARGFTVSTPRE